MASLLKFVETVTDGVVLLPVVPPATSNAATLVNSVTCTVSLDADGENAAVLVICDALVFTTGAVNSSTPPFPLENWREPRSVYVLLPPVASSVTVVAVDAPDVRDPNAM